jgi:hypothetical protein
MNALNAFFMVYDDHEGSFVDIEDIQAVQPREGVGGSVIILKSNGRSLMSPLKPREVLRRISIIRHKREINPSKEVDS